MRGWFAYNQSHNHAHVMFTQTYLTDEEFQKVFGKTVNEFNAIPEWKQKDLKKKVDLF